MLAISLSLPNGGLSMIHLRGNDDEISRSPALRIICKGHTWEFAIYPGVLEAVFSTHIHHLKFSKCILMGIVQRNTTFLYKIPSLL